MNRLYPDLFSRLVAHVDIDPHTGCWTWVGHTRRHFGGDRPAVSIRVPGRPHPVKRNAARLMCEEIQGPPPTHLHEASHLCDANWLCVCPDHLIWETRSENMLRHYAWKREEQALDLSMPCERPGTIEPPF